MKILGGIVFNCPKNKAIMRKKQVGPENIFTSFSFGDTSFLSLFWNITWTCFCSPVTKFPFSFLNSLYEHRHGEDELTCSHYALRLSITSCKTRDTHTLHHFLFALVFIISTFSKGNIVWFSAHVKSEVKLNRMRCHTLGILFLSKNTFKTLKYKFNLLSCNTSNCSSL